MPNDRLTLWLKILGLVLLSIALAGIALWFLAKIRLVVMVLIGAVFFAYLIYPAVRLLQRRLPRWLAIITVYAVLAVALGGIFSFIGPRINVEARTLASDFPGLVNQARQAILHANTNIVAAVPIEARVTAAQTLGQLATALEKETGSLAGKILSIMLSVASIATALIIVPILTFYILFDLDRLGEGIIRLFPAEKRAHVKAVLQDIDLVLGGFIRGQVIVGAIIAVVVTVMLLVLRIKYAFLIGLFAGVMDIIPYVGAIAGAIPAVLIAAFTHGLGWAVLVAASFVLMYQLEGHIIAPNVVGQRVGLTPLMVIIAILTGAELGGIGGMFVAVPLAAIARALWLRFIRPQLSVEPVTHVAEVSGHKQPEAVKNAVKTPT